MNVFKAAAKLHCILNFLISQNGVLMNTQTRAELDALV